jgi:rhomboid protease GluP
MLKRQTEGSVVCPSCGRLVGVQDDRCYSCGRWNPGLWGFAPLLRRLGNDLGFVSLIIGACSVLYVLTLMLSGAGAFTMNGLMEILAPTTLPVLQFGASGRVPVYGLGRWWTVLSAGWLHGGLLHIVFNMLWVRQLAPATADLYGAGRTVIIYTVAGACGFLLSSSAWLIPGFQGAGLTLGASASIFGLLGALVYYGRKGVSSAMTSQAISYAVVLFLFGFMMRGVDNWAHAGGFVGGYLTAAALRPMRPERQEHLVGGLVCLVLVALSIVASLLTPIPLSIFGG